MREFLLLHEEHDDKPVDLILLLLREPGDVPGDAAVWIDWLSCVRRVKGLDATKEAVLEDAVASGGWIGRSSAAYLANLRAGSNDIPER